jgi:hypothetical protein
MSFSKNDSFFFDLTTTRAIRSTEYRLEQRIKPPSHLNSIATTWTEIHQPKQIRVHISSPILKISAKEIIGLLEYLS